jgi:lambda family phage portal protein
LIANDLSNYLDAEIDGAKLAAKWLAIVKKNDPGVAQLNLPTQTAANGTDSQKIEELENAIIEYLRPGEDITFASSNRPGTTFQPFVRLLLTMLSISTGAPYELVSGDYQGLNFSTTRVVRNDFSQQLRPISARHIRQFAMPTIKTALDIAVLTGRLTLPGYWQNPRTYWASEWQPPGMDAVDPLREAKGQIEAISYGLKSPQEVARERGRDLEDIYKEIQSARELATEMGLEFEAANKSEKSNPAAIMEEDD